MSFLNEQGLERLWSHITTKLGNKVDKIEGKDLSTNDYTNEEKEKLASVADSINEINETIQEFGGRITELKIDKICELDAESLVTSLVDTYNGEAEEV